MTKQQARAVMREKRRCVSREELARCSERIFETLFALPEYRAASTVFCYLSFAEEVDTLAALPQMRKRKRVCVPVMMKNGTMRAVWLDEPEKQRIVPNDYGILEPQAGFAARPREIDFAIVPLLAFDRDTLHRVGYGRGYYDRFLEGTSIYKVGVAMQFQMVEHLEHNEFDVALDTVITESERYVAQGKEK